MIPLCDLKQQYLSLKSEIDAAMQAVAEQGNYILGPNVRALEQEVAAFCNCRYGIGVANGTDALHLALRALDIGPGDEVITTPFSFIATTEAIGMVGATPVFADIDPLTFNIDPNHIEAAITPRTKAILPVHLYGQPCDMDAIMDIASRYGLRMVEDCAQAIGATYRNRPVGSFGDAGCLSFFPSKNLGCFGDGGMVICNDQKIADRIDILRRHGGRLKYHHEELGLNSRLDELQAAILRVKLPHVPRWNRLRREHAAAYNRMLVNVLEITAPHEWTTSGCIVPLCCEESPNDLNPVYHQYTIQVPNRDTFSRQLTEEGIGNGIYYPVPLHLQRVHAQLKHGISPFPNAECAARNCLSLPMFPELTTKQMSKVTETFVTSIELKERRRSA